MADQKLTALTALATLSADDLFYVVDDPAGAANQRKMAASVLDGRYLQPSNNLSDLDNAATARTNLGLVAGGAGDIWVEKAGDVMTGTLSIPGTGTDSQRFGPSTLAGGTNSLALGSGAQATATKSQAIGAFASSSGQSSTASGSSASVTADFSFALGTDATVAATRAVAIGAGAVIGASGTSGVAIGATASVNFASSICLGRLATDTAANQLVIGSATAPIIDVYIGEGVSDTSAMSDVSIQPSSRTGTNRASPSLIIRGAPGTGTGAGGSVFIQTAPVGTTGTAVNALVTAAEFDDDATAGATRLLLWDITAGSLRRVSIGANDTGGAGFRVLRIPN